ncbi:MAG: hypothetical protein KF718_09390 [Polyangiaceae bacterium]|nr:hypothetical protein [Polyangiaceae bacterium]
MRDRVGLTRALCALLLCAGVTLGCQETYRVGEHVWVEWEGNDYPAYIVDRAGRGRFRVHFEGYDARWDEDVTLDRIKGRITGPVSAPPPPPKVARASGLAPSALGSSGPVSAYKEGDKVRVRWRGSVYTATVVAVLGRDKFVVHYDGHESAWDETISLDRIVTSP